MSIKWLTGHDGLIWFVCASKSSIGPRGLSRWASFLSGLPRATARYMRLRSQP
jgi:hypothetical protein